MSRIILPSIAVTCVALYFLTRKRKLEFELEIEPRDGHNSDSDSAVGDTQVLAE